MKSRPRELELKLQLPAAHLARLRAAPIDGARDLEPPTTRRLLTTYFDTARMGLRDAGIALRVRKVDGKYVQTIKADRAVQGGLSNPIEIETEIDQSKPDIDAIDDKDLRRQIEAILARSRLAPIFETRVERTSRRIETSAGDQLELSIDRGEVLVRAKPGKRKAAKAVIGEIEIELKAGTPGGILLVAETIMAGAPVRLAESGKADVGYQLLSGEPQVPPVAKSKPVDIGGAATARDAIRLFLKAATTQILANGLVVRDRDEPEGVHQLRVGVRRLRAILRIVGVVVDDPVLKAIDDQARDLARAAGEVRDLDVLTADIVAPLEANEQLASGLAVVRKRLAAERKRSRERLLAELDQPRFIALRMRLALLPHLFDRIAPSSELDEPVEALASAALKKLRKRVLKRGQDIETATVEQRHELRKALKSFRYAAEFFAPLDGHAKLKRIGSRASELQELLGYHNDVTLASRLPDLVAGGSAHAAAVDLAIGAIIGWHSARDEQALAGVLDAWKRFARAAERKDG